MGQLVNQTPHYIGHELESEFKEPVTVSADTPQKTINRMMSDPTFILFGDEYTYNKQLSTSRTIVYSQKAMGGLMYSSEAKLGLR